MNGSKKGDNDIVRRAIIDRLEDMKAEDIVSLDLQGKTDIADYMIIASGRSARHIKSALEEVSLTLKKNAIIGVKPQGSADSGWVLLDTGGIIIHLMTSATRELYKLEELWGKRPAAT